MPQAGSLATLGKRLPEDIGQEADQDVRQHPILFLVPDRTQQQVAFLNAKRGLRLRQLDVRLPQILVAPVCHVAA